jgi:two-component system, NarL family, sensor histidine kinase UhpB
MKNSLRILILEDDVADVELIAKTLERAGMVFTYTVVTEKSEFEAAINTYTYDAILADNSLPQFDASTALAIVKHKRIDAPFILVTGTVSEEFAVEVLQKGADDYILKGNIKKLPSAIEGAMGKWKIRKEKNMAEIALRDSEQRFRILFEQASDGIVIADKQGNLTDANTSVCIMTGYSLDELKKLTIAHTFFEDDLMKMPIRFSELLSGKTIISERRVKRKDNSHIYVELSAKMLPDGRLQAIARDVTDRKRLEAQLLAEKIDHQKKMAQATVDGQEKERTEIGKELHDNINQILSATKLFLTASEMDDSIKDDMIARSISNLSLAIEEIRKLSKALVTPSTYELGLADAIQDLVDTIQLTTPIAVHLQISNSTVNKLNNRQQIALYRIIQEQMNNIIKHADAQTIDLKLDENENCIHLVICDNGKGFNTKTKRSGIGLNNMQSRAELLNGRVNIESENGKGCILKVDLPVNSDSIEPEAPGLFSNYLLNN